jgi:hypothetical protein
LKGQFVQVFFIERLVDQYDLAVAVFLLYGAKNWRFLFNLNSITMEWLAAHGGPHVLVFK